MMEKIEARQGGSKYFTVGNFIYLLLILASMIPGYMLAKYAIEFADEPYHIMNSMDIYRSPMFPLSSWLGGILGRLTDFRWLSFRYLSVTLNYLAIVASGIYLFHRSKSIKITAITVSVAILLSGLSRNYHNLYGWDCWAAFFLALTIVTLLFFIENRGVWYFIFLCIFSALTAMARIPSAVIIPIVWFVLFISTTKQTKINIPRYYPWLYLLVSISLIGVIILGIYRSIGCYVETLQDNIVTDHAFIGLAAQIVYDTVRYSFCVMSFGMLAVILGNIKDKNNKIPYRKIFVIVASASAVGFLLLIMVYFPSIVNETLVDNYWIFLALFFSLWQFFRSKDTESLVLTISILLSGFVCLMGSNLGFQKYPGYIFIPLTTALLLKICSLNKIKYFALIAGLPLFVMETCIVAPFRSFKFGEGVLASDTLLEKGRVKGLCTTADKAKIVEEIVQFNDSVDPKFKKIVLAENNYRHVYQYLLDCPDSYARHNWVENNMLDSIGYIEWLQQRLDKAEYPIVVYVKRYDSSSSKMKEFLDQNMKLVSDKETFMVYMQKSE